ncbi:MAG: hypothetical protein AAF581_04800 [Planctomycetota bacterium]
MTIRTLLMLSLLFLSLPSYAEPPSLKDRFEALAVAGDVEEIAKLWRANEGRTLLVIDSYLEGSLGMIEKQDQPDPAKIAEMHARALLGARAADVAFGRSIFSDYTASFVGWTREQQKQFRAGQGAFGEARKAAKAGEHAKALAAAQRCIDLARPLGDWWGLAMGLSARGAAEQKLGKAEAALASHSDARLVHASLGLRSSAYRNARSIATLLVELERLPRAAVAIENALVLAREFGDAAGEIELLQLRANLEDKRGDAKAATATRKQVADLQAKAKQEAAKEKAAKKAE